MSTELRRTFGRYRLLAKLGSGGMADVFLAVLRGQRGFNKLVVLKIPRDEVLADPTLLSMFLDEARLAARLNHPNIVSTLEVINESERDAIVMEYLDGHTLNDVLAKAKRSGAPLPLWMHLHLICEVLGGLEYAHDAKDFDGMALKLVHRDVSPHNVFITFDGEVKLLDFGIAKAALSTQETAVGTFKGKVRYMPVEQLTGADVDRRADIFAAGAMTWEALTGERLWSGMNDVEVMSAVIGGQRISPATVNADASPALSAICMKALAHDRAERHANCAELRSELEGFLATLPDRRDKRAIAAKLEELFGEARRERQKVIEGQLAKEDLRSNGEGAGELPTSLPALGAAATTASGKSGNAATARHERTAGPIVADVETVPRRRHRVVIAALIGVAGIALAGVTLRRVQKEAPAHAANAVPSPAAAPLPQAATSVAPPTGDIGVTVHTSPAEAKVVFDDGVAVDSPAIRRMPKDGRRHTVRAEANGYVARSTEFTADVDKELVLVLEKVAAPQKGTPAPAFVRPVVATKTTAASPAPSGVPVPPPTHDRPEPSGPTKKGRTLDTNNPWEK